MSDLPSLEPERLSVGTVGAGVVIRAREFEAIGRFTIGAGAVIEAERVVLGDGATIGAGAKVRAISGTTTLFQMGDHSLIDENSNVMVPAFSCGDYTRIFRDALISGYEPVTIGHNCWVGQGAVLNSAKRLSLGNNVRMGGSQIWTHVASGELLLGSRFFNEAPVTVEDDVWLMGFGHMIAPGVTLGRGSVVMAGSSVTKSTEPWHTYSGVPARDITDRLPAWDRPEDGAAWDMLEGFVGEFVDANPDLLSHVALAADEEALVEALKKEPPGMVFAREVRDWAAVKASGLSVFELASRTYCKRRSEEETRWQNFALGYRARFSPREA